MLSLVREKPVKRGDLRFGFNDIVSSATVFPSLSGKPAGRVPDIPAWIPGRFYTNTIMGQIHRLMIHHDMPLPCPTPISDHHICIWSCRSMSQHNVHFVLICHCNHWQDNADVSLFHDTIIYASFFPSLLQCEVKRGSSADPWQGAKGASVPPYIGNPKQWWFYCHAKGNCRKCFGTLAWDRSKVAEMIIWNPTRQKWTCV